MSTNKLELNLNQDHVVRAAAFKRDWDTEKGTFVEGFKSPRPKEENVAGYTLHQESVLKSLRHFVREAETLRTGDSNNPCLNVSFGQYIQGKLGIAQSEGGGFNGLLRFLNIDPSRTTIQKLMTMPQFPEEFRWLVPELIRDAIETGMMANAFWNELITTDTNIDRARVVIPQKLTADTPMYRLNEGETIPMGHVQYGQKTITIHKAGTGFSLTDEIIRDTNVNVLADYLGSVGANITRVLNTRAVLRILNGDDGQNNAAPVIGVENIGSFDYDNDLLRLVIRMSNLGYTADKIITNEEEARKFMSLPEIKGYQGDQKLISNTINTAVPSSFSTFLSGAMPINDQLLFLDNSKTLMKFTSRALMVQSERIISNQTEQTYATLETGFAKMYDDASIVVDKSIAFSAQGFPAYMDAMAFATNNWVND